VLRARLLVVIVVLCAVAAVPSAAFARSYASRPLRWGKHGHDVRVLQRYLTRTGFDTTADGQFGRGTYSSVRAWEQAGGRRVNGRASRHEQRLLRRQVRRALHSADAPGSSDTAGGTAFVATSKAILNPDGTVTPPTNAPQVVKDVIEAGNKIAFRPYVYGGGHNAQFKGPGYDCSGSVSYALHGGGLLDSPLDSTSFESWGSAGPGAWITIYANGGHAYMVVAGMRFDTSGASARVNNTRWTDQMRSGDGFVVRHPTGW
jgi:peptidoglycan hydrolase-like protein with peptidoglycan-binding domain